MKRLILTGLLIGAALTGCQRFFYYPNRTLYVDPAHMGLAYDIVEYPSLNGKKLTALFFKTKQKPKGTIVHFHGNFGNVSNHFPLSTFLVEKGFDVLIFDYEGYGASEGSPSAETTLQDGIASVRYAQNHQRAGSGGVAVFGQSLGGAVAILVTAREPEVKAAVIESAFSSYRAMTRAALGRHIITWPAYAIAPWFISNAYSPEKEVGQIAPRPVFFIHGDHDEIVPMSMSKILFARAQEPKKLWIVPKAGHLEAGLVDPKHYEAQVSDFFEAALKPTSSGKD